MHTASPFHFNVSKADELIGPAVQGTLSALRAASQEPKVKRVVITASFACVVEPKEPVYTFTEKDWNNFSTQQVEEKGDDCDKSQMYRASKTLAERAAWDFVDKEKPSFDLTTIQPPLIFGPLLHQCEKPESLNTSVNNFYQFLEGNKSAEDAQTGFGSFVDVRDVAHLHVESLVKEEAGNERFLVATGASHPFPLRAASSSFVWSFRIPHLPSLTRPHHSPRLHSRLVVPAAPRPLLPARLPRPQGRLPLGAEGQPGRAQAHAERHRHVKGEEGVWLGAQGPQGHGVRGRLALSLSRSEVPRVSVLTREGRSCSIDMAQSLSEYKKQKWT